MKQITIRRARGFYGAMRKLSILIDGVKVASLGQGEETLLEVADTATFIWGKMDWGATDHQPLQNVEHGHSVTFKAYFTLNPLRNLGISALPFRITIQK